MKRTTTKNCKMCSKEFEWEPDHRSNGGYIPAYKLLVCNGCYDGNWDGWNSGAEPKLVAHLKKEEIPLPERNDAGLYPRGD